MIQRFSSFILSILGWRLEGRLPADKKLIIIGAPHTSNWDFPFTLLVLSAMGLRFSWVAKHTLFKGPFGTFFKAIGGIPVNRLVRSSFLTEIVGIFNKREKLVLAIAPEGTRSKKDHWKAGFYHIAMKANVNICLGFIDYPSKSIGVGPTLDVSKDFANNFLIIQDFYTQKSGKHPNQQSVIRLREKEMIRLQKEFHSISTAGTESESQVEQAV